MGFLQLPNELNSWLSAEWAISEIEIKRQIGYQWDNSLIKKKKIYIEGELISEIGNEFQILGPR